MEAQLCLATRRCTSSLDWQLFFLISRSQAEPGLEHSSGNVVLRVFSISGSPGVMERKQRVLE